MIQVWMLVLSAMFCSTAFAGEFNHIKLSPQFEQYLNQSKLKSASKGMKSLSAKSVTAEDTSTDEFTNKIKSSLLGATANKTGEFTNPFPVDGEESLLYEQIRANLEASHQEIGLREVTQLDFLNRQFNLGSSNFSGFSWQKPFGVVNVHADRQVTPNLFGDNWLVQDTFTFDIEATTFLQNSNEAGITSMSDLEIGAYAGITFKRVYTYYSYAASYNDGLRADFSKLFLPFIKFNTSGINKMANEEIIKRQDDWTASAGGIITTPAYYGFSLSGGVLAQFAYQNVVSVQTSTDASADKVRLTAKGTVTASAGINISIQAEFLKLLKLTILNYDLTYEYAESKQFTLGMNSAEWQHVADDSTMNAELQSIIHGYGKVKALEPYVDALDESERTALAQRGSLLIWGRLAKSNTEQIRVIKDDQVKIFYKSYAQNMRVVQNIFSRLFSAVIYKIFKLPMGTKNAALYNRQVNLEYEATNPQATDPKVSRIDSTEQFSFSIDQSYEAARTDRWVDTKFKNDVIWFVDSFTNLPKDYKSIIRSEQLKGPILVESKLLVEKAGFDYLLAMNENNVFGQVASVCGSKRVDEWKDEAKRNRFLGRLQIGNELCVKNIGKDFLEFKSDYRANFLKPSLAKFKAFLTKFYKQTESLAEITSLFGEENTFIHGQLKATTSQGSEFVTSFSTGQFRGLGVIDNYKRSVGSRQPASIISE